MEWMLLPYRRYAEFTGRSRRKEYWLFVLFYWLVALVIGAVFGSRQVVSYGGFYNAQVITNGTGSAIGNIFALASFVPGLAVGMRRLHDIDRSGWWLLLTFVPLLGWFTLLVFMCLDGTAGSNRYGADPKDRGVVDVFR